MRRVAVGALALVAVACGSTGPKSTSPAGGGAAEPGQGDPAGPTEEEQIGAIEKAMNEYAAAIHTCWAIGAADDFQLAGNIVLEIEIGKSGGKAAAVKLLSDEPKDDRLSECLLAIWRDYEWPAVFADGDKIQLPFEFVAPDAQYSVASAHAEVATLPDGKSQAWLVLGEQNTGNADAALSLLVLEPGARVAMHRHDAAELLFVLDGGGSMLALDGEKKASPVGPGSAVYVAAGTAHGFVNGDQQTTAIQLYTPAGPERRFKDPNAEGATPVTDAELAKPAKKFPRPKIRQAKEADELTIGGGKGSVRILFEKANAEDDRAYMGVFTAQPGLAIAEHNHPTSSEYLFLLSGEGEMYVAGKAMTVSAGDAIQVPRGVAHSFVVKGDEAVKAVQFYVPGGPEQRFKP